MVIYGDKRRLETKFVTKSTYLANFAMNQTLLPGNNDVSIIIMNIFLTYY